MRGQLFVKALVFAALAVSGAGPLLAETATLGEARDSLAAASAGGKVFFAGGSTGPGGGPPPSSFSSLVDVYWYDGTGALMSTTTSLSQSRLELAGTSAGGSVWFGGGYGSQACDRVDIFDPATLTRSTASLSQARAGLAAASTGTNVFFGGGYVYGTLGAYSNQVDIFDANTLARSTASLSQARSYVAAAAAGGEVLFAGGQTTSNTTYKTVDIFSYDGVGNLVHTSGDYLSQARAGLAATSAGTKVFFAGGWYGNAISSSVVDIYDTANSSWSTASLSQARSGAAAATVGNRVYIAGGSCYSPSLGYVASDRVDVYNLTTGLWSATSFSQARYSLAGASSGSEAFFGGGSYSGAFSDRVDILPERIESYSQNDDTNASCVAHAPRGQTFTLGTTGSGGDLTVHFVRLKVYKTGTPNTVNVTIKATDSDGKPVGADLTAGSFDGNAVTPDPSGQWINVPVTDYTLLAGRQYALIVDDPTGSGSGSGNYINLRSDQTSPAYTGGTKVYSYSSGATWTVESGVDLLFGVLGVRILGGDADRDAGVDFADYQTLETHFGMTTGAKWEFGDFDGDFDVDFADYQKLEANFGRHVPEPLTLSLMAAGILPLMRRRRA